MNIEKMYTTIDAHVSGEGFRVIVDSPIQLLNQGMAWERQSLNSFARQAKQLLLNEPRGHRGVNGCTILPSDKADFAALFLNHEKEEHFSYSGLVATLTVLLETGQLPVKKSGQYEIETVEGLHTLSASMESQTVHQVQTNNKSCRVLETMDEVQLIEVDKTRHYFLYPLPESIPTLDLNHLSTIMKWGKEVVEKHRNTSFNGIVLIENLTKETVRSVTFETDGEILRSPGFDSSYAIFTRLLEKEKNISKLTNQSIFGSVLEAVINNASKPNFTINAQAFITGEHRFTYDPDDPLKNGFLLN